MHTLTGLSDQKFSGLFSKQVLVSGFFILTINTLSMHPGKSLYTLNPTMYTDTLAKYVNYIV